MLRPPIRATGVVPSGVPTIVVRVSTPPRHAASVFPLPRARSIIMAMNEAESIYMPAAGSTAKPPRRISTLATTAGRDLLYLLAVFCR